ncbi:MAG: hypothetical protein ACRDOY_12895 [Nocardioidaceae bacterium]
MTLNQNLKNQNPLYAVIGVGDLVVEKIRAASTDVQARSAKYSFEPKKLQADIEAAAKHRVEDLQAAGPKAQAVVNDAFAQAVTTYDGLAGRGKNLVARIRHQEATQQAATSAQQTKTQAKATSTTASRGAAQTKSRAKATTTSAKKTASAAKKSTEDAADKVGD